MSDGRPPLTVLMPVYNEVRTLEQAVQSVLEADALPERELIVVDDGSTDGSTELLRSHDWPDNVRVLYHDRNQGKGAAVRTAVKEARGEVSAIFDADLEYEPDDIAALLEPIVGGSFNACFGARVFEGHTSHSFLYVMGNRGVTLAANLLFNVYIKDIMTCHKAIRTEIFKELPLRARGFEIEPEITARLLQRGERIYEVPANYSARTHPEGKKLTSIDGLRVLATLLRCRLTPR
ncbi:MAG TPA: glycosyltransferase family 2 protein [Thermoleophilaceae bacterium]|nr:glycosyltransferase family 2 protein [Thermoleophilaceae bacterium]